MHFESALHNTARVVNIIFYAGGQLICAHLCATITPGVSHQQKATHISRYSEDIVE